jgi:O-acetyl-ADP-ribose deacetylase (regulator of RNase III)
MGEGDEERKLASAMKSVLTLATGKRLQSISVPAISAGIFGFPKDRCATILVGETVSYLTTQETTLHTIEFCIVDRDAFGFFQDEIQKIGSR